MRFLHSGDSGIVVELGNEISPVINAKLKFFTEYIDSLKNENIIDVVPTYCSLSIYFNPLKISFHDIKNLIENKMKELVEGNESFVKNIIEIPVCYGGEFAPDLKFIATHNSMTTEEVIKEHTSKEYLIYMLGFTPGFPYLGGMSERIATPRLQTPRTLIPSGSVGIAGSQTGIYPVESPGGWQLLGRTPLELFNYKNENPFLLSAGEYIKFMEISLGEYLEIEKQIKNKTYLPKRYSVEG